MNKQTDNLGVTINYKEDQIKQDEFKGYKTFCLKHPKLIKAKEVLQSIINLYEIPGEGAELIENLYLLQSKGDEDIVLKFKHCYDVINFSNCYSLENLIMFIRRYNDDGDLIDKCIYRFKKIEKQ